jgi:hypothetical protein
MKERTKKLKELRKLASGIQDAMGVEEDEEEKEEDEGSGGGGGGGGGSGGGSGGRARDGWAAEDDAWDQAAKIGEERATVGAVKPQGSAQGAQQGKPQGAQKPQVEAREDVLFRDEHCACIEPEQPEPIHGTLILTVSGQCINCINCIECIECIECIKTHSSDQLH